MPGAGAERSCGGCNGDGQALAQVRSYQLDLEGLDASINASSTGTSTSTNTVQDVGGAMNELTNGICRWPSLPC